MSTRLIRTKVERALNNFHAQTRAQLSIMQILNLAGTKDNKEVSGNKIICNSYLATICMTSINDQLCIWLQTSLLYVYHVENRTEIENEIASSR